MLTQFICSTGSREDIKSNGAAAVFSQVKSLLKSQREESRIWPGGSNQDPNPKMVSISEPGS